jgi:hypothetical protein
VTELQVDIFHDALMDGDSYSREKGSEIANDLLGEIDALRAQVASLRLEAGSVQKSGRASMQGRRRFERQWMIVARTSCQFGNLFGCIGCMCLLSLSSVSALPRGWRCGRRFADRVFLFYTDGRFTKSPKSCFFGTDTILILNKVLFEGGA